MKSLKLKSLSEIKVEVTLNQFKVTYVHRQSKVIKIDLDKATGYDTNINKKSSHFECNR